MGGRRGWGSRSAPGAARAADVQRTRPEEGSAGAEPTVKKQRAAGGGGTEEEQQLLLQKDEQGASSFSILDNKRA